MTVCIAVACEKKYVVVATDRMLTMPFPSIEFEADYSKASEATKNCLVATAGSAIAYTPIFRNASIAMKAEGTSDIKRISDILRDSYEQMRNTKLNEEILSTYGWNLQGFYTTNQGLQPQLVGLVLTKMQAYNYNLQLLIAGVDDVGPHIYRIDNPSMLNCFDAIGYHAIGSGEIHALSTFIVNRYKLKETSLQRGLALAYEAKKRSQQAQGVGEQTDMSVVSKDGIVHLPDEALLELDKIYQKRLEQEKKVVEDMENMISSLEIAKKYIDKKQNTQTSS